MLTIRREQIHLFSENAEHLFEQRMIRIVERHWPEVFRQLRESGTRGLVQKALRRAGQYGITAGPDVARYLNLMLALGEEFERDARYPWALILLQDPVMRPGAKVERLYRRAAQALGEVHR